MNIFITAVEISVMLVSIILLVSSCVRLYRWRRSAFDTTTAYLRNFRYISPGEKVCIQAPENPKIQYVRSNKRAEAMVYWEYFYTVKGVRYCKSYFSKDDAGKLPSRIKIYYNRDNPKIMYREGSIRDGVWISAFSMILAALFLFAVAASYIW